jgi:hypothetical protein
MKFEGRELQFKEQGKQLLLVRKTGGVESALANSVKGAGVEGRGGAGA